MGTSNLIVYVPPTLFGIVALAFLLLWQLKIISAWQWSAGFAQTAAGFVLSTFSTEPSFDAFNSGLIFIGAAYCYGSGLLIHFGVRRMRMERGLFVAAYTLALAYLVFVQQSLVYQLFLTDAGFAFLLGLAVFMVAGRASRPVDIALVAASAVVVLDSVVRTTYFTFFTTSSDNLSDFADSAYNLAVHITTITVCMIFPFTALGAIASAAIERHREDAERDPLTGLLNRRGFEKVFEKSLPLEAVPGAAMVFDIDHFKRVNDSYGHAVGDKVIVALANDLERIFGAAGYVARVGGEEFVAFIPGVMLQDASSLANMLRISFGGRDWAKLGFTNRITVSIGVSEVTLEERAMEHAFLRADGALYSAKAAGRNAVVIKDATSAKTPFQQDGRRRL
ncbi:GGDEF domain-containing protein [Sinorhizobium medicae]|uniref:GGDEF domain-containing protein n=1 Tax=Sinorhizobium medicae TaxID=110321 RepID=UPI0003F976CE|nr:GGDEF domain-containing protein [Sinorhizobium medicae]